MKSEGRGHQINQRRFVADGFAAKQLCSGNVTTAAMGFDAPPVVRALKYVLAIFGNFQLDHYQTAVLPQAEQIYREGAGWPTRWGTKLRVQWHHD